MPPSSPDARHVVVHLVALTTTAVSAVQHNLSQSPGGITPGAFALALRDLPPQWPEDGSLVLQLNAGQPRERTWFDSGMVRSALYLNRYQCCDGTDLPHFSQVGCLLMFQVRFVKARIPSVSRSSKTWQISYSRCTLLHLLLRQSLLLSNGRGFASCTLFNGHRRDGRWGRFTSLELCNPSAVIPLVMRAIPVVMSQSSWRRARILEWLLEVLVVEVRKEGAPPSRTTPWNELD
jgi:hypothetical protein